MLFHIIELLNPSTLGINVCFSVENDMGLNNISPLQCTECQVYLAAEKKFISYSKDNWYSPIGEITEILLRIIKLSIVVGNTYFILHYIGHEYFSQFGTNEHNSNDL